MMYPRNYKFSDIKNWRKVYAPFGFKLYANAPLSKAYYKDIDAWEGFRQHCNISLDTKGSNKIALDVDASLSPLMRKVAYRTLSIKTPKPGYGIILDGPIPEPSYSVIKTLKLNNRGDWKVIDQDLLEEALRVGRFLRKLGLKDATAVHSSFVDTDGFTFLLLPPSITCKWQGYKGTVLGHSTYLSRCNQSPTGRHAYCARTFVNYTTELLDWNGFCKIVGLKI